jgi:hypothetical protein
VTVCILLAFGIGLIGWGVWMYRRGRQAQQIDVMQEVNDDAAKAVKAREAIDAMHADDVRAALARRVRRPG